VKNDQCCSLKDGASVAKTWTVVLYAGTPALTVSSSPLSFFSTPLDLSNHSKHAIVALERLNASEQRLEEYWNEYTHMTPYNIQLHKIDQDWENVEPATFQQWKSWRGKKINWQEQVSFVDRRLQSKHNGDMESLLSELAPDLLTSASLAGSLTHGIIHLGWGVDAGSTCMITEGLAYLNFCALGVEPSYIKMDSFPDESTPIESMVRIAKTWKDEHLQQTWVQRAKSAYDNPEKFHPELVVAGFQWELAKVLEHAHPVATEIPSWMTRMEISELYEHLYRMVTWLYLASRDSTENGNFLVLHLLTSLWGLEHVLRAVDKEPSLKHSLTRTALAQWFANMIAIVATSSGGFPSVTVLESIQKEIAESKTDPCDLDWSSVVERGIAEVEEHNIKLVYVTRELWKRYGQWHGYYKAANAFVLTPNIGPDTPEYDA